MVTGGGGGPWVVTGGGVGCWVVKGIGGSVTGGGCIPDVRYCFYCIDEGIILALTTVLSTPLFLLGMKRTPKYKISLIYSSGCHIEPSYLSFVPM